MDMVTLGKTDITVPKNGFGALPVQRVGMEDAVKLLRGAYEGGFRFFDTARAYSDSEEKLGEALADVRKEIYLATKTMAKDGEGFKRDLETSLKLLKTDYLDIYQFHNPAFCPKPGDGTGLYEAMAEAKEQGMVRHIGITNHRIGVAKEAIESGLYETLQFPFCYLATEKDLEVVEMCRKADMGFIAMKALSGGLITNSAAAYAYLAHLGRSETERAGGIPPLHGRAACHNGGAAGGDRRRPEAAFRQFLPRLRLLHALSGGN